MFVICFLLSVILFLLVYISDKEFYNPALYFFGFYGITGFIAGLQVMGLYRPSDLTYIIIMIGMGAFFGGYIISRKIKVAFLEDVKERKLWVLLYLILVIASLLFGVIKFLIILPLIRQGVSLNYIRTVYNGATVRGISFSSYIYQIEIYFCRPCLQMILSVFCIYITNKKERNTLPMYIMVLSFVDIIINQLVNGGRVTFFTVVLLIIVAMKIQNKISLTKLLMRNFKNVLVIVGLLLMMYWISILRGSTNILKSTFLYFCAPIVALSENLESISGEGAVRTYGMVLISGFIRPLYVVFRNLTGVELYFIDVIYDLHRYVNNYINVGQALKFNAFVTLFYYFYLDGGLLGVAFDSFMYSSVCSGIYKKCVRQGSLFSIALYLVVFQNLFLSFIRYQFIDVGNALAFFYLILVFRPKKRIKVVEKE